MAATGPLAGVIGMAGFLAVATWILWRVGPTLEGTRRLNIAPTENVLAVVARHGEPEARVLRWGLIPPWAKDLKGGGKLINVRVESVATKAPFRDLIGRADRRALQVVDGYFEWLAPDPNSEGPQLLRAP